MSATQSSIDVAHDLGSAAYLAGFSRKENPYDRDSEPEQHKSWNSGWDHEKNYYEGKQ